ncbi:hypothetical protein BH20ACT7_BH20ACT7_19110 [soil metagenome]|jgi:hypothetical protein
MAIHGVAPERRQQATVGSVAVAAVVVLAVTAVLLGAWLRTDPWAQGDPTRGLQQLDLLYLDEPAPRYAELGLMRGQPALLLVCSACPRPAVDAQVVHSADPAVARDYGLLTTDGRVGPGYALIDGRARVRYRTFDADAAAHTAEIEVLLAAMVTS